MGKLLWHTTMSLDGFVAGPGDDMNWMGGYTGPNPTVDKVISEIGAVLIGRRTYVPDRLKETRAYGGAWSGPQFVLTHDDPATAAPGYTFVGGDITQVVETVRAAAGDKYVAILGGGAARACLEAGLLDEILVHVAPLLLGDGVRLFGPAAAQVKLEPISVTQSALVTNMWMRVL